MKRRVTGREMAAVVVALLSMVAADTGRAGTLVDSLGFSENLADKVICSNGPNIGTVCELVSGDRFRVSAKISLLGIDITQFSPATSFALSLGGLGLTNNLGDDPGYLTGSAKATFLRTETDPKGKIVAYETVQLKWSTKQLTAKISGKTADRAASNLTPILAGIYEGSATRSISNAIAGSIDFGPLSETFYPVIALGSVSTKIVTAKDFSQQTVSKIKFKATGGPGIPPPPLVPFGGQWVDGGESHSVAVSTNGTVWAWGNNNNGELGVGEIDESFVAVQAMGLTKIAAVAAGVEHSVAVVSNGTVWAWGDNTYGQLGTNPVASTNTPIQVGGLTTAVAVTAGDFHNLAILSNGTIRGWGLNFDGELGDGTLDNNGVPVSVVGLSNVIAIAAGRFHSLAVTSNGTVWAWGFNIDGELGNGTVTIGTNLPVQVPGLNNGLAVAGGDAHSVALMDDGTVWAWGFNQTGQLGNGNTNSSLVAVQAVGLSNVVKIATGGDHNLALLSDGTVRVWGDNLRGELGIGTNVKSPTPVQVPGLSNVVFVAAGRDHSLAVKEDGTVWAWGSNSHGQLGNGTALSTNVPVHVLVPLF